MRTTTRIFLALALAHFVGSSTDGQPQENQKLFQVPYQMTATKHILVRAKINGHGPYHLVLDTGAPVIVFAKKIAQQVNAKPDAGNWADVARLDFEGGARLDNVVVRFDDLYQLEGMNGLGLPGTEIHGLVGYPALARFRITYDLTKSKLTWVTVAGKPDELPRKPVGTAGPAGLNALGGLMKGLGKILGADQVSKPGFRGLIGISLEQIDGAIRVQDVLMNGPAHRAGIRVGDVVVSANDLETKNIQAFTEIAKLFAAEQKLSIVIERNQDKQELIVELEAGF